MARITRRGATHRPEDVPVGVHKEYKRMEQVLLDEPLPLPMRVDEALAARTSTDAIDTKTHIDAHEYATLLGHALRRHRNSSKRHYPSGGALYPVETYLITPKLGTNTGGVLHYNPTRHSLERLWELPEDIDIKSLAKYPENLHFTALLVFTGVWARSSAKYGDLAFIHTLLEVGHMSENILLVASSMGIESRPMAGFDDDTLLNLIDLSASEETPIHTIVLGKPVLG